MSLPTGSLLLAPAQSSKLSSAEEAGKVFQSLDAAIGDEVIDTSKVADIAQEARDWWNSGGTRIKQIADFIRRTEPGQDDLTFSEARQFLSNASRRLSATESQNLAPQAQRYLSQFASSLNQTIQQTADSAGVGDDYRNAVNEYRGAMQLDNVGQTTKEMLTKAAKAAPWIGGAYDIAKKYLP